MSNYYIDKKRLTIALLVVVLILGICHAGLNILDRIMMYSIIEPSTAENYAYIDSGISNEDITKINNTFEKEKGNYVYKITFSTNDLIYDYVIRASDGKILSKQQKENNNNVYHSDVLEHEEEKDINEVTVINATKNRQLPVIVKNESNISTKSDVLEHEEEKDINEVTVINATKNRQLPVIVKNESNISTKNDVAANTTSSNQTMRNEQKIISSVDEDDEDDDYDDDYDDEDDNDDEDEDDNDDDEDDNDDDEDDNDDEDEDD